MVATELVQNEDRFTEVKNALKMLNKLDLDKLISSVCMRTFGIHARLLKDSKLVASEARAMSTAKPAAARVTQMLNLRNVVKNIPLLAKAMEGSRSQLLRVIVDVSHNSTHGGDVIDLFHR